MHVGSWRSVRPLRAVAGLLGMAVACAACGGGASTVSASAAAGDPCLLVSQSEAQSILGSSVQNPQVQEMACQYVSASGQGTVTISINLGAASQAMPIMLHTISKASAQPSVGHSAQCGPYAGNAALSDLYAIIGNSAELVVYGPSCSVDDQFAKVAFTHL